MREFVKVSWNWLAGELTCPTSLDLVLVVYDLIELIIEVSLWSKDYSTFDTHPQHTSLGQLMLISFV